ncbi:small subunit ribosomal protein S27e [Angomonas deanei]|uniref:Ribosomal protein S27, putative n=1 Tax=Angomonas deanei TaxID=59799 RepID=A0A7G2C2H9_9TRYP|nr:small subunit ribosomal protein S27e [Angomonas deanei]CAD2212907.1 Ribosomal protein S27, putative [Angomonas deanei]|eukprot:EPY41772.1 small subunit ribosomal protein S27e [Angomonas deanei]
MGFFDSDLSYPTVRAERQKHKRRRLVQGPNSYFLDVQCPADGCGAITKVYSHATSHVQCTRCNATLSRPTGGKAKLAEGARFRRKADH